MKIISVLVAAFLLSLSVNAQTFLTEDEMIETMVGATVSGVSSKDGTTPWSQTYLAPKKEGKKKGKVNGLWAGETYKAKWYIKKGKPMEYLWNLE